ncbi:MAG: tRNA uridine-5-carboxymethylaminomethyl(34) synthesis GTPase MnmE [Bacteroidia bacterium]|nr:tRNA uridine-5-carboxymethylaminomethyl(34) synthesis GTPase MnmE [Bacteroidia bacterium]
MRFTDDTIVAPATVPGTGAISVLRLSGPGALSIADAVLAGGAGQLKDAPGYTVHFRTAHCADGGLLDEVLCSVFRAPHSYTGEDCVEISCHASAYIVQELLCQLIAAGARSAAPGEFTRRAFLNGKMDLSQAEAVADLIASSSALAHRTAVSQLKGGISSRLSEMRASLVDLAALMELELDFSEEDVEFADRSRLRKILDEVREKIDRLRRSFRTGNAIRNGVPVAIVGAANSGKSTLLNALLCDERALVSPVAGTTRDTVEETLSLGGTLFRFIDTAGLRETSDEVESMGISRTLSRLSSADVVFGVIDASPPTEEILKAAEGLAARVRFDSQVLVLLLNKCDLVPDSVLNKSVCELNKIVLFADNKVSVLTISAKEGLGIEQLENRLCELYGQRFASVSDASDSVIVTNARHYNALCSASEALSRLRSGLDSGAATELLAQDLREAIGYLGEITGEITTDEVLGEIFGRFCIGK